jgi:hypothetical protein
LSKNNSCWDVPRSGTIPTVEFVPVKNPFIAFAVELRVRSSLNDTIWVLPILNDPVLWYPEVSKNYWLGCDAIV